MRKSFIKHFRSSEMRMKTRVLQNILKVLQPFICSQLSDMERQTWCLTLISIFDTVPMADVLIKISNVGLLFNSPIKTQIFHLRFRAWTIVTSTETPHLSLPQHRDPDGDHRTKRVPGTTISRSIKTCEAKFAPFQSP